MVKRISLLCLAIIVLSSCQQTIPPNALQLSQESLENRQLQTRRFETSDNKTMLSSAAAVLQDLGFTLDESESTLGILAGSKRREAISGGQIFGSVLLALFGGKPPPVDKEQIVRVSMAIHEIAPSTPKSVQVSGAKPSGQSIVRVTFQRVVINTANQITLAEQINEIDIYQEFFDKLSQSVFLEAYEI